MKDKTKPLFHWYVNSAFGKELVFALYTRPCRYGRCAFCSLPSMSEGGDMVSAKDIETQIDYIISHYSEEEIENIGKVSIYTASSVLDQECMPTRSLVYLALKASNFPNLKILSLETRTEYVEDWELKALKNIFGKEVKIEIGIGYETHDPMLRNMVLKKGLTVQELRNLMAQLSENNCYLKAYLMLKPHYSLTEEQGITEAVNGIKELYELSKEFGVETSIHLNPTYIAKDCSLTEGMIKHGYQAPELSSVIEVLKVASELKMTIYAGLDDEGMAIQGGTFRYTGMDKEKAVEAILSFNNHQDYNRMVKEAAYKID